MKPYPNTPSTLSLGVAPRRSRKTRAACLFAAAIAAGLSASSALAQQYYPNASYPLDNSYELSLINSVLQSAHATESLVLPTPAGFTSPDAADYAAAVSGAVTQFLAGTAGTPNSVTLDTLVYAAAAYRPTKVSSIVPALTAAIIAGPSADVGENLSVAIEQAALVAAKTAPAVASTAIATLALTANVSTEANEETVTTEVVAEAPTLAARIVSGAITAVKKSTTMSSDANDIATAAIQSAIANGAQSLLSAIGDAAALAVVKNTTVSKVPSASQAGDITSLTTAILSAANGAGQTTQGAAIQLAAGIVAGAGPSNRLNVENGFVAGAGYSPAIDTAMTEAVEAYAYVFTTSNSTAAKSTPNASPAVAVNLFITQATTTTTGSVVTNNSANPPDLDAVVAGAVTAWPRVAPATISQVLDDLTADTSSTATPAAVITAGVAAYPTEAAADAKTIVLNNVSVTAGVGGTHPVTDVGTAVGAIITGANASLVGPIMAAATRALVTKPVLDTADLGTLITGTVGATQAAGFTNAIAALTLNTAKDSKLSVTVLTDVLQTAAVQSNPLEAAEAVAGAAEADSKSTLAGLFGPVVTANTTGSATTYANLALQTAITILTPPPKGVAKNPLLYFQTASKNMAANNTDVNSLAAILYAAAEINPRGTSSLVAAAVANLPVFNAANEAELVTAAEGADYAVAPDIQAAANAAYHVASTGVSDLYDYVANSVTAQPSYVLDIVTGATVAAPGKANFIASAVGFAAPLSVGKVVPALFSFSNLTSPVGGPSVAPTLTNASDEPARAAAITAGFVEGILQAHADTTTPSEQPAVPPVTATKAQIAAYKAQLASYKSEASALKAAVSAAVRASLLLTGPLINTANGSTVTTDINGVPLAGFTSVASTGPAGVTTGYIAQEIAPGEQDIPGGTGGTVAAVITAAVKSAKAFALQITQAAVQAAVEVSGDPTFALASIEAAVEAGAPLVSATSIQNAAIFGEDEATQTIPVPGAGAAGVVGYSLHTATGTPVTSIYEL